MNAVARRSSLAAAFATALASLVLALPAMSALGQASSPPTPRAVLPDLPPSTATSASAPAAPASATAPRGPRLRSPAETGNRAAAPGDLHPERPVTPQISLPFGKTPPPPTRREERAVQRGNPAASGGVDDAAARCDAQTDAQLRASCHATVARDAKGRAPN